MISTKILVEASSAPTPADAAKIYAEAGVAVFPADPGKKQPYVKWKQEASACPMQVDEWWRRWPSAMIGLPTGHDRLVVIDVDGAGHDASRIGEAEKELRDLCGEFEDTLCVRTPSGGYHLYLKGEEQTSVRCKNGFVPGVDCKAEGGYIIAPGSERHDGKKYEVVNSTPMSNGSERLWAVLSNKRLKNTAGRTCSPASENELQGLARQASRRANWQSERTAECNGLCRRYAQPRWGDFSRNRL
jgi:hypothetical protein